MRIVAVLGLIAVLLLGAWGIIQLAFFIPTLVSNIGNGIGGLFTREPAPESITVSVPATVTPSQAFSLNWRHLEAAGAYSYSIAYACQSGLSLEAPLPNSETQRVPCNTPFNFTNASSSVRLTPVYTGTRSATTTFTVSATELATGAVTATGSAGTTVAARAATPASAAPTTPTQTPSTQYVPSGRTQNLYGSADLAVRITSVPQNARVGTRTSVQFVVENVGTNVSPQGWSFDATLPYLPTYVYSSARQQLLYPGDKIVYTLGYDIPYGQQGLQQVSILVDPYNSFEYNKANNYATASYYVY